MKPVWNVALAVATLALVAIPASAQPVVSAKSGLVSYVEGKVFVGDQEVQPSLTSFPDVKEKMVLRTTEGRAEILLTPGVFLRVGENSSFRMIANRLIDTRLEILTGSAVVEADEVAKDTNLTIVANKASVLIARHGLYRFDMEPARVKVFDGVASASFGAQTSGEQTTPVAAGRMLRLDSETASVEKFDKEATDALDRWSKRRAENVAMANVSSAKQVHDYGCTNYGTNYNTNWANPVGGVPQNSPCYNPCGGWRYNPYYGMVTYVPCGGNIYSPYGYRYFNPNNVARMFYVPPPNRGGGFGGFGGGGNGGYYPSMGSSGGGYSGAVAAAPGAGASSGAMSSSGSAAASSAGASSAGHGGGAAGGGHGK
jgi:hypothetical protein